MPKTMHIHKQIEANWGVGRLFRFYKGKLPFHGESLILSQILANFYQLGKKVHKGTFYRVLRECEEDFDKETIQWLRAHIT